jgi:hypothetical protein
MATNEMLMGLLKTPSQVRKEAEEKLAADAFARSQQMITRGGSTALPGIISGYGAQAAQRGAMAGAGLLRGISGGIGQAVGGDMGQRIADLGVSAEERQARTGQEIISGMKVDDPASIRATAQKLRQAGLIQAATQLDNQATRVEEAKRKADIEEKRLALEERRVVTGEKSQQTTAEQGAERIAMLQKQNEWTKEYQQGQQKLQEQGLDLRTNEFEFRKDQAGKISPAEQARINIAKDQLALQRQKFEELSPYQQAQIEYQEKQLELAEQRIDLQSEQAQAQLEDSKKRLQIQEGNLYASFTKESVDAWKQSGGQTALEPRTKATDMPIPKALSKNAIKDFDAALARLPEEVQNQLTEPTLFGFGPDVTNSDLKRVVYKEALRLQSIPSLRGLSDGDVLAMAIARVTGQEATTQTGETTEESNTSGAPVNLGTVNSRAGE